MTLCHKLSTCRLVLTGFFISMLGFALGDNCKGCLSFDEFSFNKIVPMFKYTLVKYDIAYPYGSKHDAFVAFAESLSSVKEMVVGEIGIKDYGQKDNEDFAKQQNVDPKKLPVIRLYKGSTEYVTLTADELTEIKLREFVLKNTDIHITLPGCVEEFDRLAIKFVKSENKKKILHQIEEYKTEIESDMKLKEIYVVYMKKLLKDEHFVGKEQKRLRKIIEEGQISDAKKQALQNKINILYGFEDKTQSMKKNEL